MPSIEQSSLIKPDPHHPSLMALQVKLSCIASRPITSATRCLTTQHFVPWSGVLWRVASHRIRSLLAATGDGLGWGAVKPSRSLSQAVFQGVQGLPFNSGRFGVSRPRTIPLTLGLKMVSRLEIYTHFTEYTGINFVVSLCTGLLSDCPHQVPPGRRHSHKHVTAKPRVDRLLTCFLLPNSQSPTAPVQLFIDRGYPPAAALS